jgi:hypothetical protein
MRSATSSHRRLHPVPSTRRRVDAIAHLVDEGAADEPGHLLVHVADDGDDVLLGLKPLPAGVHPFGELAGFTAPADWSMFGVRVRGTAHHLDGDRPPERSITTFVLDRHGAERSIVRVGDRAEALPGPASGTIPDLCRRVLGLPTAPAPPTTAVLWTVAWLDRLVEAWSDPARRRSLRSWSALAALHPAAAALSTPALDDPTLLVTAAHAHTTEWSWDALRGAPDALPLPDGHLPAAITTWMDDGCYARWALGAFPAPATLARDLTGLLEPELRDPFVDTLARLLP